ncbi:MAG: AzlD domain-containing protein [Rhizobiaceae bacterium]
MSFTAIEAWWWPYLFILLAGIIPNGIWRVIGVFIGGRIDEESEILVAVRAVATGLVAAVIGNLVVYPSGALADTPVLLRIGAVAAGFLAWRLFGRRMLVAIAITEACLLLGIWIQP